MYNAFGRATTGPPSAAGSSTPSRRAGIALDRSEGLNYKLHRPGLSAAHDAYAVSGIASRGMMTRPYGTQAVSPMSARWAQNGVPLLMHEARQEQPDGLVITGDNLAEDVTAGLAHFGRAPRGVSRDLRAAGPQELVMTSHRRIGMLAMAAFSGLALAASASAAAPAAGGKEGAGLKYQLARDAFVTLNITRPDGWVVRELIVDEAEKAGAHEVYWDGRDNFGRILPPGDYQARLLHHTGLTTEYVTSIGNSGTPPWKTADGTGGWGGNHGQPLAAAVDSTGVYLGWISTEGPYCVLKREHDGTKGIWGTTLGPFEGVWALATDEQFLYGANPKRLIKFDRMTGRPLATVSFKAEKPADNEPLAVPPDSATFSFTHHDSPGRVWGMAAGGGRIYVSYAAGNRIEVYETEKIEARADEGIPMKRPRGLALDGKGGLLVVSEGKVLLVDLKTKAARPFITSGLEAPFAVARAGDGTIYVTELGKVQQVKTFSPEGKLLAAFGRKGGGVGGERGGPYEPENFCQPTALAVNPDGSVWVVEDMIPKRIARISPDGKRLYQGFGSVNYGAKTSPNPNDPSEVFSMMWGTMSGRVDYDKKGWWEMGRVLRPKWKGENMDFDAGYEPDKCLARQGKTYLWAGPWPGKTGCGLFLVEKDHLRTVIYLRGGIPDKGKAADLARERKEKDKNTFWCDTNDNEAADPDEVKFVKPGFGGIADDFTLLGDSFTWKPKGFSATGAPLYDPADIQETPGAASFRDSKGHFYRMVDEANPSYPQGDGFWAARNSLNYVLSTGPNRTWAIGRKARGIARPGEIYYLWRIDGEIGNCVLFTDMEGVVHVIHQDGFYVQSILQDPKRSRQPGPELLNVENFSGTVMKHPKTGKDYLYISSAEASHVFEVKGLDAIRIEPAQRLSLAAPEQSALTKIARQTGEYFIARVPAGAKPADFGWRKGIIPVVGMDWKDAAAMPLYREGQLAAEVRLLYDSKNLYMLANVLSEKPFRGLVPMQAVHEVVGSGDAVELLLGLDPEADPKRAEPAAGDLRLVATHVNQQGPRIVQMRAVADAKSPRSYDGPGGKVSFDNVSLLEGAQVRIEPSFHKEGYCVEAAIPLDRLLARGESGDSFAGRKIRLDAGVTWGEPKKPAARAFWAGKRAKMLADDAVAASALYPDGWGAAVFDPQPASQADTLAARKAGAPKTVDGDAADWGQEKPASICRAEKDLVGTSASIKVAWDDQNLYALVQVEGASPWKNSASSPEMVIKGGAAVGFSFGDGSGAGQKLVVSPKGVTVYRPKSAARKPYTFKSPVGSVTLDYVAPTEKVQQQVKPVQGGYVLEVAIPWSEIGTQPKQGTSVPFDVQVIFADPVGSANVRSAWWHSRSSEAACTYDLPTEAKLYPAQWGKLRLE